eukprot:m.306010 g.306010  ORF g.306010 m.306010 type:complete len:79 (+) comp40897_c0_seq1:285-521(+)
MSTVLRNIVKHKEVVPLLGITVAGCSAATFCLVRAATKYPDVAWNRSRNPHPWTDVRPEERVKFYNDPKLASEVPPKY